MSDKPCTRCNGAGGGCAENWYFYAPPGGALGACFRCKGSGIDPDQSEKKDSEKKGPVMCGQLKLEGIAKQVRDFPRLKVIAGVKEGTASLSGFARLEMHDKFWKPEGDTVPVNIVAETFTRSDFEKKYHERWPVVLVGTDMHVFTEDDAVGDEKPGQLELF